MDDHWWPRLSETEYKCLDACSIDSHAAVHTVVVNYGVLLHSYFFPPFSHHHHQTMASFTVLIQIKLSEARIPTPGSKHQHEDKESEEVLPGLEVESGKKKGALAATPVHPEALQALYMTYVASCFVERAWRFCLPAVLSPLCSNLQPVAILGFVGQFVIFAGGPLVGAFMHTVPRGFAFNILSIGQMLAVLISAMMLLYALSGGTTSISAAGLLVQPWFLILVIAGAIERLTGLALGVAAERDWVVLLAGADRSIALANANATLRRVDLVCEIFGPFLFGILLSKYEAVTCILITCVAAIGSLPISVCTLHVQSLLVLQSNWEYLLFVSFICPIWFALQIFLVQKTHRLSKGALHRSVHLNFHLSSTSENKGMETLKQGWIEFLAQPVLPASIAYVLLCFNSVLAPSGLMTSFLVQRGLDPSVIGIYRGMCAFAGFVSTFLATVLIAKSGVLKAGALALTYQASLLGLAVLVYWTDSSGQQIALIIFLVLVVLSRLGHWGYDMIEAQIFQTAIPTSKANLVGTTEMSLARLAELLMLGVAILASDVSKFGFLAALSMAAVAGAACIYWHWLFYPTVEQQKLFT